MVKRSFAMLVSVIVLAGLVMLGSQAKAEEEEWFDQRVVLRLETFDGVASPTGKGFWFVRGDDQALAHTARFGTRRRAGPDHRRPDPRALELPGASSV